jgi:hypothetical protein
MPGIPPTTVTFFTLDVMGEPSAGFDASAARWLTFIGNSRDDRRGWRPVGRPRTSIPSHWAGYPPGGGWAEGRSAKAAMIIRILNQGSTSSWKWDTAVLARRVIECSLCCLSNMPNEGTLAKFGNQDGRYVRT